MSKGTWKYVADLSEFMKQNPGPFHIPGDFEPDGSLFSMVVHKGHFYAVEANHGQILRVNPGGHVEMFIDLATLEGHVVPTTIAFTMATFTLELWIDFPSYRGRRGFIRSRNRVRLFRSLPA